MDDDDGAWSSGAEREDATDRRGLPRIEARAVTRAAAARAGDEPAAVTPEPVAVWPEPAAVTPEHVPYAGSSTAAAVAAAVSAAATQGPPCSTCNRIVSVTFSYRLKDGARLKTCDACRARARGYYESKRPPGKGPNGTRRGGPGRSTATPTPSPWATVPGPAHGLAGLARVSEALMGLEDRGAKRPRDDPDAAPPRRPPRPAGGAVPEAPRRCSTCQRVGVSFKMRPEGGFLKTCDPCRERARGYYTQRTKPKRKKGSPRRADDAEDDDAATPPVARPRPPPPARPAAPPPLPRSLPAVPAPPDSDQDSDDGVPLIEASHAAFPVVVPVSGPEHALAFATDERQLYGDSPAAATRALFAWDGPSGRGAAPTPPPATAPGPPPGGW